MDPLGLLEYAQIRPPTKSAIAKKKKKVQESQMNNGLLFSLDMKKLKSC